MGAADPGFFALKNALRAAIVVPLAFALALEVAHDQQMALFASFGSVALLVFVDFGGDRRARLRAYLLLALAGCLLISLGTVCSHIAWLATLAMALVGFAILFAGVLNGYVAAAYSGALLTFVLAVMVPADAAAIPARLEGWVLAGALSISAVLLLWPERARSALRREAADAARAIAASIPAAARPEAEPSGRAADASAQVRTLRGRFASMQHRPSGNGSRTAALTRLVEDLGWLCAVNARQPALGLCDTPFGQERAEIEAAVCSVLESAATRLALSEERGSGKEIAATQASLQRLGRAHEALGRAVARRFDRDAASLDEARASLELYDAYRLRQLAFATMQTGRDALLSCGDLAEGDPLRSWRARADALRSLALAQASMRSVWLHNSIRGALGLALAVFVGQVSDLQHAFWIVLGTLSVLRSSALATSTTVLLALLGTLAGIVAGGLLVVAVGSHDAVLWAVLPLGVLLAGYAPRAISFAAGQAAFSFVVLVLFNLIHPVGWKVGLVRIEDVAIGAGVSLLAGALVWPRGAGAVLRDALGTAYSGAAGYLDATVGGLLEGAEERSVQRAARDATASAQRLETTVREFLAERSSARANLDDLSVLLAGAGRARRVARLLHDAHGFARLAPGDDELPALALARGAFDEQRRACSDWYRALGEAIRISGEPPQMRTRDGRSGARGVVLERAPGSDGVPPGVAIAWARLHLDALIELEPALARAAGRIGRPAPDDGAPA